MREIKFRAWDKEFKKFSKTALQHPIEDINYLTDYEWSQYTGFKDQKGNEIYEGDIIEGGYINPMTNEFISKKYLVKYKNAGFMGELIGSSPYGDTWLNFINGEVIGNIYQHPELLKE